LKATYQKYILNFKQPSGTSRGILHTKETFFLKLEDGSKKGVGECAVFRGLSIDDRPDYDKMLDFVCNNIDKGKGYLISHLTEFPSIQFGVEQAFLSLNSVDSFELLPSDFTKKQDLIEINGLIWMGTADFMKKQIKNKLDSGFRTIKMKIGAIDFNAELELLKSIRKEFSQNDVIIRVDANGAFKANEALEKLKYLSDLDIHSIEQPIKAGQWQKMAFLCEKTPLPIALDEELIGVFKIENKEKLIETIKPQFIILKPSLIGGIQGSNQWITIAKNQKIDWWITSALESNIGLNAIAQYTYSLNNPLPQGLGTGSLFTNNIDSPLVVKSGNLYYDKTKKWSFSFFE
jgi:o-succinylbenzoate synthase